MPCNMSMNNEPASMPSSVFTSTKTVQPFSTLTDFGAPSTLWGVLLMLGTLAGEASAAALAAAIAAGVCLVVLVLLLRETCAPTPPALPRALGAVSATLEGYVLLTARPFPFPSVAGPCFCGVEGYSDSDCERKCRAMDARRDSFFRASGLFCCSSAAFGVL